MAIFPKNLPGMKFAAYLQQEVAKDTGVKSPDGLLHAVGPPSESYKEEVQSETPAPQVLGAEDFLKNCIRRLKRYYPASSSYFRFSGLVSGKASHIGSRFPQPAAPGDFFLVDKKGWVGEYYCEVGDLVLRHNEFSRDWVYLPRQNSLPTLTGQKPLKLKPPTTYNVSYPGTGLSDYQKNLLEHGTELAQKSRAALEQSLEAREGKSNNVGKEAPAPSKRKIVLED